MEFRKFSSIEQFRNVIKQVRSNSEYHGKPVPTLMFTGTVKLHGTNSGIGYFVETDTCIYQSRERILSLQADNSGFMLWASGNPGIAVLLMELRVKFNPKHTIYVYGEWAGQGIQKKVAIAQVPKAFYVFSLVVDGAEVDISEKDYITNAAANIYSIHNFKTWTLDIDFSKPELVQNQLVDWTLEVEEECPVGKYFGVSDIGEGIVWKNSELGLTFKTKGEKHANSKVKTLKQVAAVDIEKMNSLKEFIESACSENRLNQGFDKLKEMGLDPDDNKSIGEYIRWVCNDIFREEADTIVGNQIDTKKIGGLVAAKARNHFMNREV